MYFQVALFSLLAGSTVFIGALLSSYFEKNVHDKYLKELIVRYLIAISTGVMLAAISFVLVPDSLPNLSTFISISLFLLGGFVFFFLDKTIQKNRSKVPQLLAMLLDFIPESIALGAVFAYDHKTGVLLSFFIALQNLPESFNSYLEVKGRRYTTKNTLLMFFALSFVGLIFSSLGYFILNSNVEVTSALMLFSAGGIMYIIFQDIAPLLHYKKSKAIAIGVNVGFVLGMLGNSFL